MSASAAPAEEPGSEVKHRFEAAIVPKTVAGSLEMGGRNAEFHNTATGYALGYEFAPSPRARFSLAYARSGLKIKSSNGTDGLAVEESSTSLETYSATGRICFTETSGFFQRLCPGLRLGRESYPILSFTSANSLRLTEAGDWTAGLNLLYESPILENLLFRASVGYNRGIVTGQAAYPKAAFDSSHFLNLGTAWEFVRHQDIGVDLAWTNRFIELHDPGRSWVVKSSDLSLRLSYRIGF